MTTIRHSNFHPVIKRLIGEPTVMAVIALNAVVLFIYAFPEVHSTPFGEMLEWIDYVCMVYFVLEAVLKITLLGPKPYWDNAWNRFDFLIVVAGIPLLMHPPFVDGLIGPFAIAPLLRMGRFLRFIRVLRFIPNAAHIGRGVVRALKASVGVFLVWLLLNILLALGATMLFGDLHGAGPYFGNPVSSIYSLFKVFTIEGWYEIPDALAQNGTPRGWIALLRIYFIVAVLTGGILGLSLANAVFVDEMTTDNTDELEQMVVELRAELRAFRQEFQNTVRHAPSSGAPTHPDNASATDFRHSPHSTHATDGADDIHPLTGHVPEGLYLEKER